MASARVARLKARFPKLAAFDDESVESYFYGKATPDVESMAEKDVSAWVEEYLNTHGQNIDE